MLVKTTKSVLLLLVLGTLGSGDDDGSALIQGPDNFTVDTGTKLLAWESVEGASSYNLYFRMVDGLDSGETVSKSDERVTVNDTQFDLTPDYCDEFYVAGVSSVSEDDEESEFPTGLGFNVSCD